MVYGTSTAICATAINSLSHFLDRKVLITAFIFIDSSILLTLLLWSPGLENSKTVLICIAAVAGISQGISQAQFNALISTMFKDNLVPAFVAYTMTKNLAASISLGASNIACMYHRLYATLVLYIIGFTCYIATEIFLFRRSKLTTIAAWYVCLVNHIQIVTLCVLFIYTRFHFIIYLYVNCTTS